MRLTARQWNILLAVVGVIIVAGSAASAYYLVRTLAYEEQAKVEEWAQAQRYIRTMSDEEAEICDLTLYTDILQSNTTIPLILVGPAGEVIDAQNFGERLNNDSVYIARTLAKLIEEGVEPIRGGDNATYFLESTTLRALRFFPIIQLALIATFILLGYFAISNVRRAEQNRVWVGMAKETAHQLGTPISAIMAWVEYLKAEYGEDPGLVDVADELTRDVDRLQLVAERFNKIGSTPDLESIAVGDVVGEVYAYMVKRAPRKVDFTMFVSSEAAKTAIGVNRHLFAWVLENLVRNALDAMDGTGTLVLGAYLEGSGTIEITVADSGKGIAPNKRKAVFRPGYTTKSRGWGLGLSLAKRIVEDYHGGEIFVKDSAVGQGATFAIRLPASDVVDPTLPPAID